MILAVPQWQGDPLPSDWDWVLLTSGEWLKGEVESLYDRELVFDSDNLGDLTIDLEDIAEIRTQRVFEVRFNDGTDVQGRILWANNEIRFNSADGLTRRLDQLVSMAQGAERERDHWDADLSVGSNFKRGNTNENNLDINVKLKRQTSFSRLDFGYLSTLRDIEGEEVQNSHRFNLNADRFINTRLYWRPLFLEYFRDELQNIRGRGTVGTGIGWHVKDTTRNKWDLTAGPGYQGTTYVSVQEGEENSQGSWVANFESNWEYEITKDIDFNMLYTLQLTDSTQGRAKHHLLTGIEVDMFGDLEVDISLLWDRIEEPQPDAEGNIPKKDDTRLVIGVSYTF